MFIALTMKKLEQSTYRWKQNVCCRNAQNLHDPIALAQAAEALKLAEGPYEASRDAYVAAVRQKEAIFTSGKPLTLFGSGCSLHEGNV